MLPRPTFLATSTSRPGSIENDARPSTSDGAMPQSSRAIEIAWHASESSESSMPLPNAVWPTPTIAVRSFSGTTADSLMGSVPLELGGTALAEARGAFGGVGRRGHDLHELRLELEHRRAVDVERAVEQPLRIPDRLRRPLREPLGPFAGRALELGSRDDLVHDPDPLGIIRREVVAEEHELLRLVQAHDSGQRVDHAAVGDETPPHEHLDEPGGVGGDDQVGGQRHRDAAAGRGAVECADDRLLAVEEPTDEPLDAGA